MTNQEILYAVADRVARITLNRPDKLNAWTATMEQEVRSAVEEAERDGEVRVIILTGGGRGFCAGADMSLLGAVARQGVTDRVRERALRNQDKERKERVRADFQTKYAYLLATDKPVIAAIAGHAVAGGLELALWCDLRVAEDDAVFGVFSRRWGVPLIDGGTIRLPRIIGHGRAMDMILTGRPVDAAEALEIGLANRVVAQGESRAAAEAWAAEIARFPEICMKGDRRSAYEQWGVDEGAARLAHGTKTARPMIRPLRSSCSVASASSSLRLMIGTGVTLPDVTRSIISFISAGLPVTEPTIWQPVKANIGNGSEKVPPMLRSTKLAVSLPPPAATRARA